MIDRHVSCQEARWTWAWHLACALFVMCAVVFSGFCGPGIVWSLGNTRCETMTFSLCGDSLVFMAGSHDASVLFLDASMHRSRSTRGTPCQPFSGRECSLTRWANCSRAARVSRRFSDPLSLPHAVAIAMSATTEIPAVVRRYVSALVGAEPAVPELVPPAAATWPPPAPHPLHELAET